MAAAVDSSVLFDFLTGDSPFAEGAERILVDLSSRHTLLICEPVYGELAAYFESQSQLDAILDDFAMVVEPVGKSGAYLAGVFYSAYRKAGGPRTRILTDFLIAGHAVSTGVPLVTRDQGFYRKHFEGLEIIAPEGYE